jgi:AcrR family transcriptional regulator
LKQWIEMQDSIPEKDKATPKATTERILDAAECLFANQGIRATSLREITEQAGINNAAVNYYFRSKDALVRAVFERSFKPLNRERLRLLDEVEAAAGDGPLRMEAVLYALFEPMVRAWREDRNFIFLVGRLHNEPDPELNGFVTALYDELLTRFLAATVRAIPELPEPELFFWVYFLFGGVVFILLSSRDLERLRAGGNLLDAPEDFLQRLIAFGAAGIRARVAAAQPAVAGLVEAR